MIRVYFWRFSRNFTEKFWKMAENQPKTLFFGIYKKSIKSKKFEKCNRTIYILPILTFEYNQFWAKMCKLPAELCRIEVLTAILWKSVLGHFREFHQNQEITGLMANLACLQTKLLKFYRNFAERELVVSIFLHIWIRNGPNLPHFK